MKCKTSVLTRSVNIVDKVADFFKKIFSLADCKSGYSESNYLNDVINSCIVLTNITEHDNSLASTVPDFLTSGPCKIPPFLVRKCIGVQKTI